MSALFQDNLAIVVVHSPPYGQQHDYLAAVSDWDALVQGAFSDLRLAPNAQMLVCLELYYTQHRAQVYRIG